MRRAAIALFLAAVLTVPGPAAAFDLVSLIPTIIGYIDGVANNKKAKKLKKELSEKLVGYYKDSHRKSLAELTFLAHWQEVSAQAHALSSFADQLLFVEPFAHKYPVQAKPDLFLKVLTVGRAEALLAQCKKLTKKAKEAVPKATADAFVAASLLSNARSLETACSEVVEYRKRVGTPPVLTTAALQEALPGNLETVLPVDLRAMALQMFAAAEEGAESPQGGEPKPKPEPKPQAKSANPTPKTATPKASAASSRAAVETVSTWYVRGQLVTLKKEADEIQNLSFTYLNSLFDSMKKGQLAFIKKVDPQSPDLKKIGDLAYPSKSWTDTAKDVLTKIDKAEKEEKKKDDEAP